MENHHLGVTALRLVGKGQAKTEKLHFVCLFSLKAAVFFSETKES